MAALDLDLLQRLVRELVRSEEAGAHRLPELGPAAVIRLPRDETSAREWREAREAGEALLRENRLAAVLLAGGQGTRLGFDGPKGAFPFAPVTRRTLFHHHAAKVAAIRARYGCDLPLYVMTSPQNDAATRELFAANARYGLPEGSVRFFVQGTMPAVDIETGAVLLEAPDRLALSPDGHGGLLAAMRREGVLEELRARGVETVLTFQVDNPLLRLARPELIGFHALRGAEMSSVVVAKLAPEERMGVVATVDGRTAVVEYSDLPDVLAGRLAPDGSLELWAGSIAVHCLQRTFVERLTEGGLALPFHRAEKRVPYVTPDGGLVEPERPNAVKFETFLFDALPLARAAATVESDRAEEFSPIKNAEGADSPETAVRDLNRLYGRWLSEAGVAVPCDAEGDPTVDIEIDPRLALDAEELAQRLPPGMDIEGPTVLGP